MPGVMRDDFLAELPETCVWRHHGSAETKQVLMSAADNSGISHTDTHRPLEIQTKAIRRFVITEKAPIRAFSWLKAATTAFTFKTLLRHYAKRVLTPRSVNVKLGP